MGTDDIKAPTRRSLLQRGGLAMAGVVGLGLARAGAQGRDTALPRRDGGSLTLYGRQFRRLSSRRTGEIESQGDRLLMCGELLDRPDGRKVGEFYSACFCPHAPFGVGPHAASTVEFHTFNLDDGTLIGAGSTRPAGTESVFAIVGGTGRYQGARGSYIAYQAPGDLGGDGTAEFALTIALDPVTSVREHNTIEEV